jgi:hypothetical protein
MSDQLKEESAAWLQHDAAYLYRMARDYRDRGGILAHWHASLIQNNAAHSARLARQHLGMKD